VMKSSLVGTEKVAKSAARLLLINFVEGGHSNSSYMLVHA